MDPNANLQEQRRLARKLVDLDPDADVFDTESLVTDASRLAELVLALDNPPHRPGGTLMYRILTFPSYTWLGTEDDGPYDCLEDALIAVQTITFPWRIQEWIDIRNGPAEAGFWRDTRYWIDGEGSLVDPPPASPLTIFKAHSEVPVPSWLSHATDASWGNDAAPKCIVWVNQARYHGVEVWVNYPDPGDREFPDRYMVVLYTSADQYYDTPDSAETVYQGDDEQAAIAALNRGVEKLKLIPPPQRP